MCYFGFQNFQAIIHLESIQSHPKQIEYLDSLVDKFIFPNPDIPSVASIDEREELSSIFLEVIMTPTASHLCCSELELN